MDWNLSLSCDISNVIFSMALKVYSASILIHDVKKNLHDSSSLV